MAQAENFIHVRLDAVIRCCQDERGSYYRQGQPTSPACVELFRRAWAGDQDAWAAIRTIFEPLMRAWIGNQRAVDADDVLQEALLAFARWAPRHPELLVGDELSRPLAFLRQCTKTALLMQLRSVRRHTAISLEGAELPPRADATDDVERRLVLHERARLLLKSPEEELVFTELLIYGLRPQEIYQRHAERFDDISALRTIIQRILRRLRNDAEMQAL